MMLRIVSRRALVAARREIFDDDADWDCGKNCECGEDDEGFSTCEYVLNGSYPLSFWETMVMELIKN